MTITDAIIILVITAVLTLAIRKIRRDKKKGIPCTGCSSCPMAGQCESSH